MVITHGARGGEGEQRSACADPPVHRACDDDAATAKWGPGPSGPAIGWSLRKDRRVGCETLSHSCGVPSAMERNAFMGPREQGTGIWGSLVCLAQMFPCCLFTSTYYRYFLTSEQPLLQ